MNELLSNSPIKPPNSILTSPLKSNDRTVMNVQEQESAGVKTKEDDLLPVTLKLGSTKLIFTDNGWELEDSKAAMYQSQKKQLEGEMLLLEEMVTSNSNQNKQQAFINHRVKEECNLLKFKNQLLIEMLAISQVDHLQLSKRYENENLRCSEYRKELETCYRKLISLNVDPATLYLESELQDLSISANTKTNSLEGTFSSTKTSDAFTTTNNHRDAEGEEDEEDYSDSEDQGDMAEFSNAESEIEDTKEEEKGECDTDIEKDYNRVEECKTEYENKIVMNSSTTNTTTTTTSTEYTPTSKDNKRDEQKEVN